MAIDTDNENEMLLQHTVNDTTVKKGICSATVIASTRNPYTGTVITTMELVYPRFIHSEFMTHRMFSRNASSSRAIPVERLIKEATVIPIHWTKNEKGMVGKETFSEDDIERLKAQWGCARYSAKYNARNMSFIGVHKQVANRLLEPFSFIRVVCTATEWNNFFTLRMAPDAEPHMNDLAHAMYDSMYNSVPIEALEHKPYCDNLPKDFNEPWIVSGARCARVSYNKYTGVPSIVSEDTKLYKSLRDNGHMTPLEHYCFAYNDKGFYANLRSWASHRYCIEHNSLVR